MKVLTILLSVLFTKDVYSQICTDSLIYRGKKYCFTQIDSITYENLTKNNMDKTILYSFLDNTNEIENINRYSKNVFRDGHDLVLLISNKYNIKLTNIPGEQGVQTFYFIDFNQQSDFYIINETTWEYHTIILVGEKSGMKYQIPANLKIFPQRNLLAASYIDFVNGGSWAEVYTIKNNMLIPLYIMADQQDKWLFDDLNFDSDNNLIVRCLRNYRGDSYKFFKVQKK